MYELDKRLEVDLTVGSLQVCDIDTDAAHQWLGGRTLNVATLLAQLSGRIDPLSPDNILLLSCGLLTGSGAPSAARLHVNAVSPLTGLLGSSNVGGYAGTWLRACGFLTVKVQGASRQPVFLEIDAEGARLHDAQPLWGLDTVKTHQRLVELLGSDKIQSLVIGPAGENRTRFACIVTDRDHVAGRTGLGAVMGSKQLKAIVIHKPESSLRSPATDAARRAMADYTAQIIRSADFKVYSRLGGAGFVRWADHRGLLSTRHYRQTHFAGAAETDSASLDAFRIRSRGCARCPVQCKAALKFSEGRLAGRQAFRPEFEPTLNLGAKCGLDDIQAIVDLDNLCTRLGIDSTSAAAGIAFVMDLAARGLIPSGDFEDLDLSWGNSYSMEILIRQMAAMHGPGGLLGLGVRRAARRLGPATEKYAAQVKGLELTAYHPGALLGCALGYAVSSRGGDYNNIYATLDNHWTARQAEAAFGTAEALDPRSYAGKGRLMHRAVLVNIMLDTLGICKVPALSLIGAFDLENEARLATALTGWPLDAPGLFERAEKTAAMERLINMRCGMVPADDTLPEMFFSGNGLKLDRVKFHQMVKDFYATMGWTADGQLMAADVKWLEDAAAALA